MEEKRLCISITDEEHWAIIAGLQMLGDMDKNPYLTEEQWEFIKANAPMKNGQQIIYWRIIVDDPVNWTEEPDFMSKARFFIKYDQ